MGAKKIIHIEDSSIVKKTVRNHITHEIPDVILEPCESLGELKATLNKLGNDISLVITDLQLPDNTGYQILEWIKSHPKYHHIPTIVLSAESEPAKKLEAQRRGALCCLEKPYSPEDIYKAVKTYSSESNFLLTAEIDKNFVENTIENLKIFSKELLSVTDNSSEQMLQILHKMKGDALVSQWPVIAYYIHDLEDIWLYCIKKNSVDSQQLIDITNDGIKYLFQALNEIKDSRQHTLPSQDFKSDIDHLKKSIDKGWARSVLNQVRPHEESKNNSIDVDLTSFDSVRISREELEDVYNNIKKISHIRTKMTIFLNQLKQEFSDEPFINEFHKMLNQLSLNSINLTEFFLKFRTKEIKSTLENIKILTKQTADSLNKNIKLIVEADEHIAVDRDILNQLESIIGHLVRNSLDHGLEDQDLRISKGKEAHGNLHVNIKVIPHALKKDDEVFISVKDDGSGINLNQLRNKIKSLDLLTPDQIANLSDKNVLDFIFVDAVSTKETPTLYSGRGVGLSLVKKTIVDLGGSIEVETGDWGTRFEIKLPRFFRI